MITSCAASDRPLIPGCEGRRRASCTSWKFPRAAGAEVRLRLTNRNVAGLFDQFDEIVAARLAEADEFYAGLQHDLTGPDAKAVQRQAFAGMIWSKQYYRYDVPRWLEGDSPLHPAAPTSAAKGVTINGRT